MQHETHGWGRGTARESSLWFGATNCTCSLTGSLLCPHCFLLSLLPLSTIHLNIIFPLFHYPTDPCSCCCWIHLSLQRCVCPSSTHLPLSFTIRLSPALSEMFFILEEERTQHSNWPSVHLLSAAWRSSSLVCVDCSCLLFLYFLMHIRADIYADFERFTLCLCLIPLSCTLCLDDTVISQCFFCKFLFSKVNSYFCLNLSPFFLLFQISAVHSNTLRLRWKWSRFLGVSGQQFTWKTAGVDSAGQTNLKHGRQF